MKVLVRIDGLARQWQGEDVLSRLSAVYPQGQRGSHGHMFLADLDSNDERLPRILEVLKTAGLESWNDTSKPIERGRQFVLRYMRIYDEDDLDACEYLELCPWETACVEGIWRRPQDPSLVLKEPSDREIVCVERPCCYAVVERGRQALEAAGLRNLIFRPAEKQYESVDYDLYDEEDTWWELRSDLTLPPLSPSMTLVQKDRTPFSGDFRKGCLRLEGLHSHAELHYRREDLAKVEPFDLALTHEMFSTLPNEYDRPLVASRRFYQVCREHNLRTGWVPVRIDD